MIVRFLAGLAVGVAAWTLILVAGYGLGSLFGRVSAAGQPAPELELLACLQSTIENLTEPGQRVRLETPENEYLFQRIVELAYPRIDLVEGPDTVPLLAIRARSPEEGPGDCADLDVDLTVA